VSTVTVHVDNDDLVAACWHVHQRLAAPVPTCRWLSLRLHGRAR
jgi:hypothetical protein